MEKKQSKREKIEYEVVSKETIDSFNTVLKNILKAWNLIPLQDFDSIGKLRNEIVQICANVRTDDDKDNVFRLLPYLAKIPYHVAKGLHFSWFNKLERSFENYGKANYFCNYTLKEFQEIKTVMYPEFVFPICDFLENCCLITKILKEDSSNVLECKNGKYIDQVERFRNLAEIFRKISTDIARLENEKFKEKLKKETNEKFNEELIEEIYEELNNMRILSKRVVDTCEENAEEIENDKLKEFLGNSAKEIQFPVGQGGLHLGVINDFAYIYDCGALDKNNAEWDNHFSEIRTILKAHDVKEIHIYISHMHYDHCNKLFSLTSKLENIGICSIKIYIPKITTPEKILLLLNSNISIEQDYEFYQFVCDPRNFVFSRNNQTNQIQFRVIVLGHNQKNMLLETDLWILDPFVFEANNDKELNDFLSKIGDRKVKEFLNKLSSEDTAKNLFDYIDNNKDLYAKLQREYRNHFKSNKFHESMLCLYSGPKNHYDFCQPHCYNLCQFYKQNRYFSKFFGWLHTGDIDLNDIKNTLFYEHYKEYLPNKVSIMQIPHHGSQHNHDAKFLDIFDKDIEEKLIYLTINNHKHNKPREAKMDVSDISGLYYDNLQVITKDPNKGLYFQILLIL